MQEYVIDFGREICGDLKSAEQREWLVTNGIGGFASGTVAGLLTRRYHGLLMAALKPPLGRTLLVSKLSETAEYEGQAFPLSTDRWASGTVEPRGYRHTQRFRLEGTTPVWTFALADALLEKRIWMEQGSNTTYVRYDVVRANAGVRLSLKALVNYRDYHSITHGQGWWMDIKPVDHGLRVLAYSGADPFYLLGASAAAEPRHEWYLGFDIAQERLRGFDSREDHLYAGYFSAQVDPGGAVTFVVSTDPSPDLDGHSAWQRRLEHEKGVLDLWEKAGAAQSAPVPPQPGRPAEDGTSEKVGATPDGPSSSPVQPAPGWIRQMVLAADQFIAKRPLRNDPDAHTVIAGYHWFGDWGRDTMISLPGLTLITGRPEVARSLLRSYASFEHLGLLPNQCSEADHMLEFNTVDAGLWYFEAVRQYFAATSDEALLEEVFPVLDDMVQWMIQGTRFNIHADPADGLLYAGEPGVQLTWMDAKVEDWVVTPRIGKPVEVNALWHNALAAMVTFARRLQKPRHQYQVMAERARQGFQRFWNETRGWCFDVLDGPDGDDPSLRPNQLFALSLHESLLSAEQERSMVDACARYLLTSYGLRSLAPHEPGYMGHYAGDQRQRDAAYHQGTVWSWLIGPFVLAHLKCYHDPVRAASFLEPFSHHLTDHGLGSISEIFEGEAPFAPRGCIAQAWSVAEVLRAWAACAARQASTVNQETSDLRGGSIEVPAPEGMRAAER